MESITFLQGGDKDTFRLQLNHVLCCRPWGVLPDMLDLFEQMNHGRWKNIFDKSQRVTLSSQGKTWATAWRSWWGNTLLKLFNPYVETSLSLSNNYVETTLSLSNNYVETTLYFLTIMHFHISYLFLSLENAHRQLNDHESHSNWIESQIESK